MTDALSSATPVAAAPRRAAVETRRAVIETAGPDAETLLQGLLSNDVTPAGPTALVYAALLSPQGKFAADAFVSRPEPELFRLDVAADGADRLLKLLTMYKLRAKLSLTRREDLQVVVSWLDGDGTEEQTQRPPFAGAARDPRDIRLGWRGVVAASVRVTGDRSDRALLDHYDARLIACGAPRAGADLAEDDAYILEYDFERLNGVDFKKGCYVGQEVTARMRHKTELRRGLYHVRLSAAPPPAGAPVTADGRPAGRLGASAPVGDGAWAALALLRKDRLDQPLAVGDAPLEVIGPATHTPTA